MQKTNFPFEVLVHDDASTDKSADIIREYEAKYPEIIKPIYQTENQYSKGRGAPRIFQEPRIKGKYVAFCEGDDYWTDPLKLQKQYDAMEAHPEVDMCAHAAVVVKGDSGEEHSRVRPATQNTILTTEQVIDGGGGYVATASLFYRADIIKNPPKFRQYMYLDYTLQICGALRGGMLYIDEYMSVYRWMTAGSWTARMGKDYSKREKHKQRVEEMMNILNEETEGKYDEIIKNKILKSDFNFLLETGQWKRVLSKKYKKLFSKMSFKERMAIIIKAILN